MADFGKKLQSLRLAAGLSQWDLADKSGVSVRTIQEYEQGRRKPQLAIAAELASALGVSLDAFQERKNKK